MASPSICMKVLFWAKTKVFSSPVSANVNSGPRCSNGMGGVCVRCIGATVNVCDTGTASVFSDIAVEVDCRNGGSVSGNCKSSDFVFFF